MTEEQAHPKTCPKCKQPLKSVQFEEGGCLSFNEEEGVYEDGGQTSTIYRCPECGEIIGGLNCNVAGDWGFIPDLK